MNQEDRERLVRIETNLNNFMVTVEKHVVGRVNDHGSRIRALEVFKNQAVGTATFLGVMAGIFKGFIQDKITK